MILFAPAVSRAAVLPPEPFVVNGAGESYMLDEQIFLDTYAPTGLSGTRAIGGTTDGDGDGVARAKLSEIPVLDGAFRLDFDIREGCIRFFGTRCAPQFRMARIRVEIDGVAIWEFDAGGDPMQFNSPSAAPTETPLDAGIDFGLSIGLDRVIEIGASSSQGFFTGASELVVTWRQDNVESWIFGPWGRGEDDGFVLGDYADAFHFRDDQRIVPLPPALALLAGGLGALALLRGRFFARAGGTRRRLRPRAA